jgi:hypothetical protein
LHDVGNVLSVRHRVDDSAAHTNLWYENNQVSEKRGKSNPHDGVPTFPSIEMPGALADRPASTLSSEDLPAPLGPRMALTLPAAA